jgi:glycosyltransferase involved in cell wall biosynthesis
MLFSVVIPSYNRANLLSRAIASVREQQFTDYEIIVVDDGSQDGTRERLQGVRSQIRYLWQENRGPGAARNAGIRAARGDYIAFLDSDDLWFPWTLSVFAQAMAEHGQPAILGGRCIEFANESELVTIRSEQYEVLAFPDYLASSRHPFSVGSGTCVLRRRELVESNFLEDRLNSEDHDLILRMGTRRGFVQVISPATLAWRRHPASETHDLARAASGGLRLVKREQLGAYPGGVERSLERHRILARHIRPIALACLRAGAVAQAWRLYRATLRWNIALAHWRYVLAFPVLLVMALTSRVRGGSSRAA